MSGAPLAALRSAAALVYCDDLSDEPTLADAHHLVDVLRVRGGEAVIVADGRGRFRRCHVAGGGGTRRAALVLEADGEVEELAPPSPPLTVAFALPKGERADWAVQKLAELGVDRIVPLLSDRTVIRLDGPERARRGERLRKVAREAGAQSRRIHLPEVVDPLPFREVLGLLGPGARLAEPGGSAGLAGCDALLVGPEGGWSPSELASGLPAVGLGEGVLRAETAAVVAGALLVGIRAGLVGAPGECVHLRGPVG